VFEFGPYRLDEPARVLRKGQREVQLQPRVFDLLVYLVRSRERVISKDELLDKLWPGVLVTDNSLQRAISTLRGALRDGGMDKTIRSFPRNGYRFCLDDDAAEEDAQPAALGSSVSKDDHEAARRAIDEHRWRDAAALFAMLDAQSPLNAEDLDRWGLTLQCQGTPSDAIPVLVRASSAHAEARDGSAAAASAIALSTIHLERGEGAIAKGWLARAADLIADNPNAASRGRLLYMQARLAGAEPDPQRARELAEAAYHWGRSRGDLEVEALGLMYRGFYRMSLGDTTAGLADQDHAAALALSGKIDPVTGGTLYCNILWACRTFGDWARANQWTLGYQQFYTGDHLEFSGSCQLHRAEVLGVRGSLRDALAHVNDALADLSGDAPWAIGDAHRVLGDIEAAIGNQDTARAAYEKSYALGWNPEPGHAMLLLEQGEGDAAFASLERSLIGQSWWTLQRQGMLLAYLALVAAHTGREERAEALIADLAAQELRWPMPSIKALTNEAAALLAQRRGESGDALRRLHLARQLWTSIDCRLNATRLRIVIAAWQIEAGDSSGAATELRAASAMADDLGSDKLKQQVQALEKRLTPP
jgi:DNA-binding winged helix-turn-helix (wHTH) protein